MKKTDWLKAHGIPAKNDMHDMISVWAGWYSAQNNWYSHTSYDAHTRKTYAVERLSIRPARRVCSEWASLLMNEKTRISSDSATCNEWLTRWIDSGRFMMNAQRLIEQAFALGSAAFVVSIRNLNADGSLSPDAVVTLERRNAPDILPITYRDGICTECAFTSKITHQGKLYDQVMSYTLSDTGYTITTAAFDDKGMQVRLDGIAETIELHTQTPPFCLVRPGIENTYQPASCMGVSVFDDALGAIKLVDEAFDNMNRDITLGHKMVWLSERMLRRETELMSDGTTKERYIMPFERNQHFFALTDSTDEYFREYNPDLRVADNRLAIQTGLSLLGACTGLGNEYFHLDGKSGIKTATEVVAEQSDLFRNLRKHENSLAPALETVCRSAMEIYQAITGISLGEPGIVRIDFDDSVIEDSQALENRDRLRVGAGLMNPYEYRMRWYGEDEQTAKEKIDEMQELDMD